jgi:membrane-associated protease RseP (regulator of RpoE activity)
MSASGQRLELAQCEQAHSSLPGPAVTFRAFRGDPVAMAGKIFINYRRDDSSGMAGRLHDRLANTFGRAKLFMDVDHIPVGTDFVAHLNRQVAECDVILVVIGPNWLGVKDDSGRRRLDDPDDFVAIEIAAALTRDIRVIPVLVDGAPMPKASELPDSLKPLARRHAVDVRHAHFGHDADALVARMREALGDDAGGPRRWRVRSAIGATAVVALLLIGSGGYAFIQHMLTTIEQTAQQREAELKVEWERQTRAVTEAREKRKADEAERQRLADVKAEQERLAGEAAAEAKRKADEAEQRQPPVVNSEEARRGAFLGANIQRVTDQIAESLNITSARGAFVASVEEGSAKAGGIEVGDVIVKFDGKDIKDVRDLPHIVADTPVGKEVQVIIIRNGAEQTKTVKIGVLTAEEEEKQKAQARSSALVSQGKTDTNAGDHDRAIAAYGEAIQLDPTAEKARLAAENAKRSETETAPAAEPAQLAATKATEGATQSRLNSDNATAISPDQTAAKSKSQADVVRTRVEKKKIPRAQEAAQATKLEGATRKRSVASAEPAAAVSAGYRTCSQTRDQCRIDRRILGPASVAKCDPFFAQCMRTGVWHSGFNRFVGVLRR